MISRNKTRIMVLMLTFMIIMLLTACEKSLLWVSSNVGNNLHASYKLFTGNEVKKIKAHSGETMIINYNSKVKKGALSMKLYDPDDTFIKEFATNEAGTEEIIADKDGKYKLEIVGEGTSGSFEVDYKIE
jgi:hypothetical protein